MKNTDFRLLISDWLRRAAHVLVYAALGLMALFTEREFFKLTPVDVALGLAAGLWGMAVVLDWKGMAPGLKGLLRYWPMGLYAGWMAVSACFAELPKEAAVKVVQTVLYFVVAVVLLDDFFSGVQEFRSSGVQNDSAISHQPSAFTRRLRRACLVVLAVFVLCLAVAVWQYVGDATVYGVRGLFKHGNVFGGYVALLAPVCFAVLCHARQWWLRVFMGLVVATALVVTLGGAAYVAVLLAMAGIAAVRGKGWFVATCAALVVWQGVVLERCVERGWMRENVMEHLGSVEVFEWDGQPALRYAEWQAALLLMTEYPIAGVGPGHYQRMVGQFYGTIPRSPRDKNESDVEIQNQYLVLGATTGWPGLLAFLAMVVVALREGVSAAWKWEGWLRGLAVGCVAGLLAFSAVLVWHSLLVRGTGLVFVALLAACHVLNAKKLNVENG